MNRNTRARFNVLHDAFARIKRRGGNPISDPTEVAAAALVGNKPRISKYPKVARQKTG